MTKKELIRVVSDETGITRKDVRAVFNSILTHIEEELRNKRRVLITGFGTFEVVERAVSSFGDGKSYHIITPLFKAGKTLKESIGGKYGSEDPDEC